jgi:hypothetical protein
LPEVANSRTKFVAGRSYSSVPPALVTPALCSLDWPLGLGRQAAGGIGGSCDRAFPWRRDAAHSLLNYLATRNLGESNPLRRRQRLADESRSLQPRLTTLWLAGTLLGALCTQLSQPEGWVGSPISPAFPPAQPWVGWRLSW